VQPGLLSKLNWLHYHHRILLGYWYRHCSKHDNFGFANKQPAGNCRGLLSFDLYYQLRLLDGSCDDDYNNRHTDRRNAWYGGCSDTGSTRLPDECLHGQHIHWHHDGIQHAHWFSWTCYQHCHCELHMHIVLRIQVLI